MNHKKLIYPVSCLVIALSLTACGTYKAAPPNTQGARTTQVQNQAQPSRIVGWATTQGQTGQPAAPLTRGMYGPGTTGTTSYGAGTQGAHQMAFDQRLADRVVHAADQVPGVQSATAIVRGNDIVVGINTRATNQTATQQRVIENQVHAAVRSIAPGHNIRITSDAPMVTRIRTLAQSIRGYGQEMTNGPTTVGANLTNAGRDFGMLLRDLGRTVTAPFR